jgi:hypothetical protein
VELLKALVIDDKDFTLTHYPQVWNIALFISL